MGGPQIPWLNQKKRMSGSRPGTLHFGFQALQATSDPGRGDWERRRTHRSLVPVMIGSSDHHPSYQ